MTTSQAVRNARAAAGMTQIDLAVASGVSPATVHRVEAGRHQPSRATLVALSAALGVLPESLAHTGDAATGASRRGKTPDEASTAKQRLAGTHQGV